MTKRPNKTSMIVVRMPARLEPHIRRLRGSRLISKAILHALETNQTLQQVIKRWREAGLLDE